MAKTPIYKELVQRWGCTSHFTRRGGILSLLRFIRMFSLRYTFSSSVSVSWCVSYHFWKSSIIQYCVEIHLASSKRATMSMYCCLTPSISLCRFLLLLGCWCTLSWADCLRTPTLWGVLGCPSTSGILDVFSLLPRSAFYEPHHCAFCPTLGCLLLALKVAG